MHFGYLDPGSGSMVLQMLLGGLASAAVAIKMFGKRLLRYITFWRKDEAQPSITPAVESENE
jgi:hypothetical protein